MFSGRMSGRTGSLTTNVNQHAALHGWENGPSTSKGMSPFMHHLQGPTSRLGSLQSCVRDHVFAQSCRDVGVPRRKDLMMLDQSTYFGIACAANPYAALLARFQKVRGRRMVGRQLLGRRDRTPALRS